MTVAIIPAADRLSVGSAARAFNRLLIFVHIRLDDFCLRLLKHSETTVE